MEDLQTSNEVLIHAMWYQDLVPVFVDEIDSKIPKSLKNWK